MGASKFIHLILKWMESNKLRVCPWLCFSPPSFLLLLYTHVLLGRDFLEAKTAWLVLAPNKVMCTCVFLITLGRSSAAVRGALLNLKFNRSSNYYSIAALCVLVIYLWSALDTAAAAAGPVWFLEHFPFRAECYCAISLSYSSGGWFTT
jgi:hypothetical protein